MKLLYYLIYLILVLVMVLLFPFVVIIQGVNYLAKAILDLFFEINEKIKSYE